MQQKKKNNEQLKPIEGSTSPTVDSREANMEGRRGFLVKSSVLLAALGMTGLTGVTGVNGSVAPQCTEEQAKALQATMDEAMRTGSVKKSLASHGQDLPEDVKGALSKLTAGDLRSAASLNKKLSALRARGCGNNGIFGM